MIPRIRNRVLLLALSGVVIISSCNSSSRRPPTVFDDRPNIILIYADDIDCESVFAQWPGQSSDKIRFPVLRELALRGTTFTNFHVTTPVCGPSRACLFSGQYAHRNGVRVNSPGTMYANGFDGGYRQFDKDNEVGGWMKRAGYETAYVGKYMHDQFEPGGKKHPTWRSIKPAGWDHFLGSLGGGYFSFGRVDCEKPGIENIKGQYRTDVEARSVVQMLQDHQTRANGKPLFLCWGPFAAHLPSDANMDHPRHKDLYSNEIPSGVQEIERYQVMQNQPLEPGKIPTVGKPVLDHWSGLYRKRLRAMKALDEGLGQILKTLDETGQRDNTLILFTSDHGYSLGQHRHFGKRMPIDRVSRVPLIVVGPGVPANQSCDQLLANIDLAPTLLGFAGAPAPANIDGISFAKLLTDPGSDFDSGRRGILIENWDRVASNDVRINFTYSALRTPTHLYTQWATGGRGYFDIQSDPEQVNNLYSSLDANRKAELDDDLRSLHQSPGPPLFSKRLIVPEVYKHYSMSPGFMPVEISGFVEDDSGVARVELELHSTSRNQYWDGHRWQPQPVRIAGTLAIPDGIITKWSYRIDTSEQTFRLGDADDGKHDMKFRIIATDMDGNETQWEPESGFQWTLDDPETWLRKPENWNDPDGPVILEGRAADNTNVARVELLFQDMVHQLFWNGSDWVKERSLVNAELTRRKSKQPGDRVRWSYAYTGPPTGKVYVCARAFDAKGNYDASVAYDIYPKDE